MTPIVRLRTLAILAEYNPEHDCWNDIDSFFDLIQGIEPAEAASWLSQLTPLNPAFTREARTELATSTDSVRREQATLVLANLNHIEPRDLPVMSAVGSLKQAAQIAERFAGHNAATLLTPSKMGVAETLHTSYGYVVKEDDFHRFETTLESMRQAGFCLSYLYHTETDHIVSVFFLSDCDWEVLWHPSAAGVPTTTQRTSDGPILELVSTIPLRPSDDPNRPKVAGSYLEPESLLRLVRWSERTRATATVAQAVLADQDEPPTLATRVIACSDGIVRTVTWNGRRPLDRVTATSIVSSLGRKTTSHQQDAPILALPAIDFHRCDAFTVEAVVDNYSGPVCSQGIGRSMTDLLFWTSIHTNTGLTIHGIGWKTAPGDIALRSSLGTRQFSGHIALVWDSGTFSLFANGTLVDHRNASSPAEFNDANRFLVGAVKRLESTGVGPIKTFYGAGEIRDLMVSDVARCFADPAQLDSKVFQPKRRLGANTGRSSHGHCDNART